MEPDVQALTSEQYDAEWDRLAKEREAGGNPPPEIDPPAPEPTATAPAATTAAPAAEDPLASLPQAVRDKLAQIDRLSQDLYRSQNDWKAAQGRIGAMQQELATAKQAAQQSEVKPSDAQIAAAAKSPQKWEAMKQDFPEWAEGIEAMLESRLAQFKPQQQQIDPSVIDQRVMQALANDHEVRAQRAQVEGSVESVHPGWKAKVGTDEFASWHATLPPGLQRLADSPNPQDAVYLLDMYAARQQQAAQAVTDDRKQRLQQAATTKPGVTPPRKSEDEMSFDELWDHEAKKRVQQRDSQTGRYR